MKVIKQTRNKGGLRMKDCKNCESDLMSQVVDLSLENDRLKKYSKLLEQGLDISRDLNQVLRENNEELRNKLKG